MVRLPFSRDVVDGAQPAVVRIPVPAGARWRPGDLVDARGSSASRVWCHPTGAYPQPGDEGWRMSASRARGLWARARVTATVRGFFQARGFLEIDTPLRVPAPGLELHLDPEVSGNQWLVTSPEFQMKRLLVAGFDKLVSINKCFRANENGLHHSPEFTMVEWYRAWTDLPVIVDDLTHLIAAAAIADHGTATLRIAGREINAAPPWCTLTVAEAMTTYAGVALAGDESPEQLTRALRAAGIDCGTASAWDDLFFAAFVGRVEPALAALPYGVVITRWPAPLAALARKCDDDPRWAERAEAYAGGIEFANGFGELTDATEQRQRFVADIARRAALGRGTLPIDERFLAALAEGMPPSAGIALGLDRLVMAACGIGDIRNVLAFASDEL